MYVPPQSAHFCDVKEAHATVLNEFELLLTKRMARRAVGEMF